MFNSCCFVKKQNRSRKRAEELTAVLSQRAYSSAKAAYVAPSSISRRLLLVLSKELSYSAYRLTISVGRKDYKDYLLIFNEEI